MVTVIISVIYLLFAGLIIVFLDFIFNIELIAIVLRLQRNCDFKFILDFISYY